MKRLFLTLGILLALVSCLEARGRRGGCSTGFCQPCCPVICESEVVAEAAPVVEIHVVPIYVFQYLPAIGLQTEFTFPDDRRETVRAESGAAAVSGEDLPPIAFTDDELPPVAEVSAARPVFLRRCAVCHQEPVRQGGVTLLSRDGEEMLLKQNVPLSRIMVLKSVTTGRPLMPLGSVLSADELEAVRDWAAAESIARKEP